MRLMTVLGTRPEIIRLSRLIPLLDTVCEHTLVHTGQNFEAGLSDIFFRDLGVRAPDVSLGIRATSFGEQVAQLLASIEQVMLRVRPDRFLLLGDTNSGLSAIVAKRLGIPVYHMEAGNRCYDDRVPDELERAKAANEELLRACIAMGGTVTGEHGVGMDKAKNLPFQYADADLNFMYRLRRVFDPDGVMNPGKLLPAHPACGEGFRPARPRVPDGAWI